MPSPARRFEKRPPSLDALVQRVDAQRPGEITGDTVPTGFGSLDKVLGGGMRRRDLILLGGDIGSGKSALALGIALRVAQQSLGVAFLSGEMRSEEHTSELQSRPHLVCRLLLEKIKNILLRVPRHVSHCTPLLVIR